MRISPKRRAPTPKGVWGGIAPTFENWKISRSGQAGVGSTQREGHCSTLSEAELFAIGVNDILYAVGISPRDRVLNIRAGGCDLSVLDSIAQAEAVAAKCSATGKSIPVMIQ